MSSTVTSVASFGSAPSSSTNSSAPRAPQPAPARDPQPRQPSAQERRSGEDFERLLRQKSARHEEDEGDDVDAADPADTPPLPTLLSWAPPPLPKKQEHDGPAAGIAGGAADGAAARARSSAELDNGPQPLAAPANAAGTWELTLRQPLSAPLDLRATRSHDAANGWSLQIGSPAVDASVLARHAPRLNERLKARALGHTHVRIEERGKEDPA